MPASIALCWRRDVRPPRRRIREGTIAQLRRFRHAFARIGGETSHGLIFAMSVISPPVPENLFDGAIMNKALLLLLGGVLILSGCARSYIMTLNNGSRIQTSGKPHLDRGFYYYKDALGHDATPVFSGSVREVAPASMATKDESSVFKPVTR
jgi:hypothetical protein